MTETRERVHVAWGVSRAQSVRDALRLTGLRERVIALSDALHVGPIDPPDPGARRAWALANLRRADWHVPEAPWTEAVSPGIHPVFWVCLSDAGEHASYLAFASRMTPRMLAASFGQ